MNLYADKRRKPEHWQVVTNKYTWKFVQSSRASDQLLDCPESTLRLYSRDCQLLLVSKFTILWCIRWTLTGMLFSFQVYFSFLFVFRVSRPCARYVFPLIFFSHVLTFFLFCLVFLFMNFLLSAVVLYCICINKNKKKLLLINIVGLSS